MLTLAFSLVTVVVAGLAILWVNQRQLIYYPDATQISPSTIGLQGFEECVLHRPNGIDVIAWYGKASPFQPTILYFHGNSGNLAVRSDRLAAYHRSGRGVYIMSYRGYSGSDGIPTEANNISDALAAYDDLRRRGVEASDIILYGESLGSGVAVQVAAQRTVGGVILDAPFTSLIDAGRHHYPYLPVKIGLQDRYDSLSMIDRIRVPLLIVHGERDAVVPFSQGRRLFAAANQPKEFVAIAQAGHSDHYRLGSFQAIQVWIDKLAMPVPAKQDRVSSQSSMAQK
ncbi:MAG: alpha/beta hydrolase [Pseudomonadota bacterium]